MLLLTAFYSDEGEEQKKLRRKPAREGKRKNDNNTMKGIQTTSVRAYA